MKKQILGIGIATFDIIVELEELPGPDDHVFMLGNDRQAGGIVGNALAAVSRLGMPAAWAGKLGADEYAKFIMSEMTADGIDTQMVISDPAARTPFSVIMVDRKTRGRTILSSRGDSGHYGGEIPAEFLSRFGLIHLDGYIPDAAFSAARRARDMGIKVSVDAGLNFPRLDELVPLTDILIPTRAIAGEITGEHDMEKAMKALAARGPEIVCITMGSEGCMGLQGGEFVFVPAFKVDVQDTTAAGDTFHGAFAYAYLQGWPLETVMKFASATAALKCTKMGARRGIPRLAEVELFLSQRGVSLP